MTGMCARAPSARRHKIESRGEAWVRFRVDPTGAGAGRPGGGVVIGDAVAKGECVSSRVLVWCLLAPSRGGVLLLGETWSAVLTLGDPCLL